MILSPDAVGGIGLVDLKGDTSMQSLLSGGATMNASPAMSPDGRWLAYASSETGRSEVYVRRFPELTGAQRISRSGGVDPLWSPNGTELFFLEGEFLPSSTEVMMVVSVEKTEADFVAGVPVALFDSRHYRVPLGGRSYDVSPDGKRFLMIEEVLRPDETERQVRRPVVVLNWTATLDD